MIEVTRPWEFDVTKETSRIVWRFQVLIGNSDNVQLVLSEYLFQNRPSKRHNWKTVKRWDRLMNRQNTISLEEVDLPSTVGREVVCMLIQNITYSKEYRR